MSALDSAWQAALAAEQQACFGYGLLGPYLPSAAEIQLADDCSTAHQALRDATITALIDDKQDPDEPPADYPLLYPVTVGRSALELAVRLEDDAAVAWRYLYAVAAATTGSQATALRGTAQAALSASAVRAIRWRVRVTPAAATVAFPGI